MRSRLYMVMFLALAAGAAAANALGVRATAITLTVLVLSGAVLCLKAWRGRTALVLVSSFLCMGMFLALMPRLALENGMLRRASLGRPAATLEGRVLSEPSVKGGSSSFFLQVSRARAGGSWWALKERVLVQAQPCGARRDLYPGVYVTASGTLAPAGGRGGWVEDHGAGCLLRCSDDTVSATGRKPDPISSAVAGARTWLSAAYDRLFSDRVSAFLEGVTLSKIDRMDPSVLADLRAAGLSHIVAVSGLNVSAAALLVLFCMSLLGIGRKTRYAAAGLTAFAVLALADFRPSATRAGIMASTCYCASVGGFSYDPLAAIAIAGMVITCANTRAVLDPGFQYSFAAAAGIVLAASRWTGARKRSRIGTALAVCAAAQLSVAPFMLLKGEPVPVVAILANVLVVPLAGLLLLTAWAAAITSAVSLPAARLLAVSPALLSRFVLGVASACSKVPGSGPALGVASVAALCLYICALVLIVSGRRNGGMRAGLAFGVALLLVLVSAFPVLDTGRASSVTVLDVGEGDAILLSDSAGARVLVDGGPDGRLLLQKLRARAVGRLDMVIATHPHADHEAGLVEALRVLPTGMLMIPEVPPDASGSHRELLETARERGVRITEASDGQVIAVSRATTIEVLLAPEETRRTPEDLNECSIVALAEVDGLRTLLCGDAEVPKQETLLRRHPDVACDVLKIAHQGSAEAASPALLEAARPSVAAISVGRRNTYGHPTSKCLALLASRGIPVVRTDLTGDISFSNVDGRIGLDTGGR